MMASTGRGMSDREMAADILAGQKYISNYYYGPAILEAGDTALRSSFQEIHAGTAAAAKEVFDYMQAKGWYQTKPADEQDMSDLRNAINESQGTLSQQTSIGGTGMSMNQGQQGWTGTQSMEGQSGFGPSNLSQGARWGGEPSWSGGFGGQYQGIPQQVSLPGWTRAGMGGQQGGYGGQSGFAGQGNMGSQGWTGTQSMEGQSGYGPSSLSQGVRYGGEPSWSTGFGGQYQGVPQQVNLPSWVRGGLGGQQGVGGQSTFGGQGNIGSQGWTGTQSMEGQSGFGPSSLSQGARFGGQTGLSTGFGGQYQGVPQQVNLPSWARGGFGNQQGGIGSQGTHTWQSSFQTGGAGWTGTQAGEGQSGYGPSSLESYGTGNWQQQRQQSLGSQGGWQSS